MLGCQSNVNSLFSFGLGTSNAMVCSIRGIIAFSHVVHVSGYISNHVVAVLVIMRLPKSVKFQKANSHSSHVRDVTCSTQGHWPVTSSQTGSKLPVKLHWHSTTNIFTWLNANVMGQGSSQWL